MKEIAFQKKGNYAIPFTDDDVEKWSNYKDNQIVKAKVVGFQKQRSVAQLGLLMACINEVVKNTENENWSSKERSKLSLKAMLGYVDTSSSVVFENKVIVKYRSFSFKDNICLTNYISDCFGCGFPYRIKKVIRFSDSKLHKKNIIKLIIIILTCMY